MVYDTNLMFIGLILLTMVAYPLRSPDLCAEPLNWYAPGFFRIRARLAVTLYTLAILVALLNPFVRVVIYFAEPLIFIVPIGLEQLWCMIYRRDHPQLSLSNSSV